LITVLIPIILLLLIFTIIIRLCCLLLIMFYIFMNILLRIIVILLAWFISCNLIVILKTFLSNLVRCCLKFLPTDFITVLFNIYALNSHLTLDCFFKLLCNYPFTFKALDFTLNELLFDHNFIIVILRFYLSYGSHCLQLLTTNLIVIYIYCVYAISHSRCLNYMYTWHIDLKLIFRWNVVSLYHWLLLTNLFIIVITVSMVNSSLCQSLQYSFVMIF
jgi:hypothetical protein